jgi:Fe-S cluster assembly ATP-binding protein
MAAGAPTSTARASGETRELRISGLRAGVPGREVLRGIDLTVRSGEVHAVMGPNGSGKSTLAHVIMGRPGYEVLGGSVTIDGEELLGLPAYERARRGLFLAPQYPTEVPGVPLSSVLEEALKASEFLVPAGGPRVMFHSEAHRVGLDDAFLSRAVNVELSGGERKRSEVLQLGVLKPAFAVLDELDSGLDVDGLRAVGKRVHEAVGEWEIGVLAITHYRRLLTAIRPDVVHVLVDGQIVTSGGPELAEELEKTGYASHGGAGAVIQ